MAKVQFSMEADEAKVVQALIKIIQKEKEAARGMKGLAEESKRTKEGMDSDGGSIGNVVDSIEKKVLGLIGGVSAVKQAFAAWKGELDGIGNTARTVGTSLAQAVSGAGDAARISDVRKLIESYTGSSTTMAQGVKTYESVRGAMPMDSFDRVMDITRLALDSQMAGMDPTSAGTVFGELAKLMPEKDAGDIADLGKAATEMAGRWGGQLTGEGFRAVQKFTAADAGSAEEGLALLLSSMAAGQGAEGTNAILEKLVAVKPHDTSVDQRAILTNQLSQATESIDAINAGTQTASASELERLQREKGRLQQRLAELEAGNGKRQELDAFYAADPAKRLEMLRTSRDLDADLFGTRAPVVAATLGQNMAGITKSLVDAQTGDLSAQSKALLAADPGTAQALANQAPGSVIERMKQQRQGFDALSLQETAEAMDAMNYAAGMGPNMRALKTGELYVRTAVNEVADMLPFVDYSGGKAKQEALRRTTDPFGLSDAGEQAVMGYARDKGLFMGQMGFQSTGSTTTITYNINPAGQPEAQATATME